MCLNWLIMAGKGWEKGDYNGIFRPSESVCSVQTALGSVHISSRGNILAQKRACRVENARKVSNLAALFALQARFCAQNLTRG
jgi:hypothetical protein